MENERTLYRKHGKPERAMAEIRRMLLQKITDRIKKERLSAASVKESASGRRIMK